MLGTLTILANTDGVHGDAHIEGIADRRGRCATCPSSGRAVGQSGPE
jgi:hypothetical protein